MVITRQLLLYMNGTMRVENVVLHNRQTYWETEVPVVSVQAAIPANISILKHHFELVVEDANGYDVYEEV